VLPVAVVALLTLSDLVTCFRFFAVTGLIKLTFFKGPFSGLLSESG